MSADPDAEKCSDAAPKPSRFPQWIAHSLALVLGTLGLACAVALPFAPVWTDLTEVRWPAHDEPAQSTTALFTPYRPAQFRVVVPCSVIQAGLDSPERTTIFTTLPPGSDRDGMVLATELGEPQLILGQREVPLAGTRTDCALTVEADSARTVVTSGSRPPITLPGIAAPEIFTFATDLPPEQAGDISVLARTFSWFDTSPTEFKSTLITAALTLAAVSLGLLFAHTRPRFRSVRPLALLRRVLSVLPLLVVDAVIGLALAGWGVIGPLTDDDGFAMLTVRNYEPSGDIGNYYRWFNASETPFTLLQHLMRLMDDYSLAPVALRIPSVIAGWLTWLVISHGIVGPLCRGTRRTPLHLLTAVFFLACWLPYGVGVRPEAFIALGAAAVVAALLKATSESTRAPFWWLGSAALATGLTVAVTPTGVTVLFTVAVFVPRICRLLTRRGRVSRWLVVPARVALVASLGSVGLVAMFADSTYNAVKQATDIHNEFGPSLGWYQEVGRYSALLGTNSWGTAGKRLVVFLGLAALVIVAAAAMRHAHRLTRMPETPLLLGAVAGVFATLWVTPSKWTHHFGALAGVGAALLAVSVVLLVRAGKVAELHREARLLGVFGGLAAAVAAALSFMGPNAWWYYSDIAMPWGDAPVRPSGLALDSPGFWIAVGVSAGALTYGVTRSGILHILEPKYRRGSGWRNVPSGKRRPPLTATGTEHDPSGSQAPSREDSGLAPDDVAYEPVHDVGDPRTAAHSASVGGWWSGGGRESEVPLSDRRSNPIRATSQYPTPADRVQANEGIAASEAVTRPRMEVRPQGRDRRGGRTALGWTAMPSTVLSLSALASVAVLIGTFVDAPQKMGDRYSVARANWNSITDTSCGIEEDVETLPLAEDGTLQPVGGPASLEGFAAGGGLPDTGPPQEPDLFRDPDGTLHPGSDEPVTATPFVWGSLNGGPQTTGSLTTEWFDLPPLQADQTLAVWVAGRPEQGNSLTVEFGDSTGGGVRPVSTRRLQDLPPTQLPFDDPRQGRPEDWRDFRPWRLLTVEARDVPQGADRVRLEAEDGTTDPQGWLAVSGPVVRDVVGLNRLLDGHAPTLIDWPISYVFPCRIDYPRVGHGTADSPELLITPAHGEGSMAFDPAVGGVFAAVPFTSRRLETPSRLTKASNVPWGRVYSVTYDVERDVYDIGGRRVRTNGAGGDGGYPFEDH